MRDPHNARRLAASTALGLVMLAACGETAGPSTTGAGPAPSSPATDSVTTSQWSGETIPDGTYVKTATMADAKRLGLPKDVAIEVLGEDGKGHLELRLDGEHWAQFGEEPETRTTFQGDGGTLTYDADGNVVVTSTGCGCTATVPWAYEDQVLTLGSPDTTGSGDPVDLLIARLTMEGEWTAR